jgi:hypothetical protein
VTYEVTLGPAAKRFVLGMRDAGDRKELADALRTELAAGPNADKEFQFDSAGDARLGADPGAPAAAVYTAIPLSFSGYTAIHRPMTKDELRRLRQEQGQHAASRQGFFVIDILPAESAWFRLPRRS